MLLALLSVGCQKDPRTIHGVNSEIMPYLQQYILFKKAPLKYDIPIQFATLDFPKVGMCTIFSSGERQIEIDNNNWHNFLSEEEKLQLVLHELGHCDLNRNHIMSAKDGVPVSIMYPYVFPLMPEAESYYIDELFNPTFAYTKMGSQYDSKFPSKMTTPQSLVEPSPSETIYLY